MPLTHGCAQQHGSCTHTTPASGSACPAPLVSPSPAQLSPPKSSPGPSHPCKGLLPIFQSTRSLHKVLSPLSVFSVLSTASPLRWAWSTSLDSPGDWYPTQGLTWSLANCQRTQAMVQPCKPASLPTQWPGTALPLGPRHSSSSFN